MLESSGAEVGELKQSRREPLSDEGARDLLASVDVVVVVRGKARREIPAREASLDDLRGPSGSFRAPILRIGRRLLVGFQKEALEGELAR